MATKNSINNKTGPLTITDSADITKEVTFNVAGVTTGTTRTWTVDDRNIDFDAVATSIGTDGSDCTPAGGTFSIVGGGNVSTSASGAVLTVTGSGPTGGYSAFLAGPGANLSSVTGNGTTYTLGTTALTEIFDVGSDFNTNGTFTAPQTGKYYFDFLVYFSQMVNATSALLTIDTSNRSYSRSVEFSGLSQASYLVAAVADMDSSDTCQFKLTVSGEASDIVRIHGGSTLALTHMSGYSVI